MSSESDTEEFFDAADVTPIRTIRQNSKQDEEKFPVNSGVEAERQRLLEQRKLAEERRRKEELEICLKLQELEQREQRERELKEAALRADERDRRRKRLVEMRLLIADETTPGRPPPRQGEGGEPPDGQSSPSITPVDHRFAYCPPPTACVTSTVVPSRGEGGPGVMSPGVPAATLVLPGNGPHDAMTTSTPTCKVSAGLSPVPTPSRQLSEEFKDAQGSLQHPRPPQATVLQPPSEHIIRNLNGRSRSEEKVMSKHLTPLAGGPCVVESREGGHSRAPPMQEPDIIQSTKSLPRGSAPPVAPPRRKKKNRQSASEVSEDSAADSPASSRGDLSELDSLQALQATPTYNLTAVLAHSLGIPRGGGGSRQSLDLQSATQGDRMVTAAEEESARGDGHVTPSDAGLAKKGTVTMVAVSIPSQQKSGDHNPNDEVEINFKAFTLKGSTLKGDKLPGGEQQEIWPISMKRPRSNSGSRCLTDKEILESVFVLNLDSGEKVPLSLAEDKLPRCMNPLSLHIMRRTKEYSSDSSLHKYVQGSDAEDGEMEDSRSSTSSSTKATKKKGKKFKKLIGKKVHKVKMRAAGVFQDKERDKSSDEEEDLDDMISRKMIKVKASHAHKGPYDFDLLVPVQDLHGIHQGAVWTMKFSHCGRLLATGGQDNLLRVWVLKDAYAYFDDMRQKYSEAAKVSPAPSQDSVNSEAAPDRHSATEEEEEHAPFVRRPFCTYRGHSADLLDLSWSKNYFILSSSMDKTVRLWHVSRKECLCCFQHIDFVTAIAFHPKDDRYFLSGSLDGKLRLWNIPDKRVALWNEVSGQCKLITAANFCLDGKLAVVGTYDGRCILYTTDQLKYSTQIHVRSTRGKNARGRKVTGVEPMPGESKILVTSNDSRIRLYDLRDLTLTCKYKGCANNSSQIKASFSHDGKYIVCGSEDKFVYIWRAQHDFYKFYSVRRDRNDYWEGIRAHLAVTTAAVFAPVPRQIIKRQFEYLDSEDAETAGVRGEVLISADFTGAIKIFINKFKPGSG